MKQRTLKILYEYWNEVRAGRIAPQRLEIEPARIAGILSETLMLERIDADRYTYRLAGSRTCELFGLELRGRNYLDAWGAADRETVRRLLTSMSDHGAATALTIQGSAGAHQHIQLEALLLPLQHTDGQVSRIIGAIAPVTSPHWLHHEPLRNQRLLEYETIWPDGRPHAAVERMGPTPFFRRPQPAAPPGSERPRLRVLEGGRGRLQKR